MHLLFLQSNLNQNKMKFKSLSSFPLFVVVLLFVFSFTSCEEKVPQELPNILWLVSEDNSPLLGCYGDDFATTPNLDKLATEGFLYTHAYANAPVCAPARNTIITGVYACSNGNQHMRSYYSKSDEVKTYPEFLREIGYYCTNNSKTDYNTNSIDPSKIWDESSRNAHYKNRADGQPFFAVFNCAGVGRGGCLGAGGAGIGVNALYCITVAIYLLIYNSYFKITVISNCLSCMMS